MFPLKKNHLSIEQVDIVENQLAYVLRDLRALVSSPDYIRRNFFLYRFELNIQIGGHVWDRYEAFKLV